jgi:hypothetical protein
MELAARRRLYASGLPPLGQFVGRARQPDRLLIPVQSSTFPPSSGVHVGDETEKDLADLAAVIALADFVVVPDNTAAHLAGAMGKPVCVMLPFVADWRWHVDRDDCPWYPSARLFRQPKFGDWASVMSRVVAHLEAGNDIQQRAAAPASCVTGASDMGPLLAAGVNSELLATPPVR